MANRAPRKTIRRSELAHDGRTPPLWRFGFPFKYQYALEYARRHALTIEIHEDERDAFEGREVLDFSETDDSWLEDEDLAVFLKSASEMMMVRDLSRRCGFRLELGSPFTDDWDGLVSLWSNYNIAEKFKQCGRNNHGKVTTILTEAMNEGKQHPDSFGEWWFDWNNEVVSSAYSTSSVLRSPFSLDLGSFPVCGLMSMVFTPSALRSSCRQIAIHCRILCPAL